MPEPIDLRLDRDGDLVVGEDLALARGLEAVRQAVAIRIRTFRGEWFLDRSLGVPYIQDLLGRPFDRSRARAVIRDAVLDTPGVEDLLELDVEFDRETRQMRVSFRAASEFGEIEGNEVI